MMTELRRHLRSQPACDPCRREGFDTAAAAVALLPDDDDPDLIRPVSACRLHREMLEAAPHPR